MWLVTLLFSVRRNSYTESLDRGVEKIEKSSRIEYRKVPETTSFIANKQTNKLPLVLLLHAIHYTRLPRVTARGCYLKSIRHTDQTHEAFKKSLDLKMKIGKNLLKIKNIPGELTISKDCLSGTAYKFALSPNIFPHVN